MKVLWFTNTSSNYKQNTSTYNGGGWISSLETHLTKEPDIQLGIAFFHHDACFKAVKNNVTYYPVRRNASPLAKTKRFFQIKQQDKIDVALCLKVIEDFKPNVIQIFGTESCFGLLSKHTNVPIVVHLQGLMAPYINAWVPPFYTLKDYFLSDGWAPWKIALKIRAWHFNKHAASREKEIMRHCKHFMGRTEWDKAYTKLYAPQATYYHCFEILRDVFYEPGKRTLSPQPHFISTLSSPLYKGHDMVLKTAQMLKETGLQDFKWDIYGISSMGFAERKTGIKASAVNVHVCGIATPSQLKEALLTCTAFIHPSYIDNSPNSVCEAQILGIPVIACNVGGVSSIIQDGVTGILVPSNDPYTMAVKIRSQINDDHSKIGAQEQHDAMQRHNPETITQTIANIYASITP